MSHHKSEPESILARWSRLSLRAKGVAVISVPLAALFISLMSIYVVEGVARDAERTIVRVYSTRDNLRQFHLALLNAGMAVTGYVATGDTTRLLPFDSARSRAEQLLAAIPPSLADDAPSAAAWQQ